MSSYLNIFLVPKNSDKPLYFQGFSRNNDVYQAFNDVITPPCTLDGDTYMDLTVDIVDRVIDDLNTQLNDAIKRRNILTEAYNKLLHLNSEVVTEYLDEYQSQSEYISSLEENIQHLKHIRFWIQDIKDSDFEKVVINVSV